MHSLTCVLIVVCVVRKLRLCPSHSRRRDCINLDFCVAFTREGGMHVLRLTATSDWLKWPHNSAVIDYVYTEMERTATASQCTNPARRRQGKTTSHNPSTVPPFMTFHSSLLHIRQLHSVMCLHKTSESLLFEKMCFRSIRGCGTNSARGS